MTIPRISVIIPVYNTEAYLRPLFDSLCRQIFTDFEIVVINDGSTDNSLGVISKYSSFFGPRLRIYSQENKGLSSTRNIGISRAKGKYISFIDSDDYISDSFYDILVKNISDDEDIIS